MGKKKAIKLATATAIAASAFVAVAPTQSEAATSSVDKAITKASSAMLKAFNTYNKTARVEGKLPALSTIKKDVKSAQDAYKAATKEIASKGGTKAQKAKLTAKLDTNKKYLDRAELYLKAVTTNLKPTKTAFTDAVASGKQSKVLSTQKAYQSKITEFEANVKKVYGPDARDLLTEKYADAANKLVNSVNDEMTVYKAYKEISVLVGEKKLDEAEKLIVETKDTADKVAKLDTKLAKNITNAVVKINKKFEDAQVPSVKEVSAINSTQAVVTFEGEISEATATNFTLDNGLTVVKAEINPENKKEITLTFNKSLADKTDYKLTVNGVKSASGIELKEATTSTFTYEVGEVSKIELTKSTFVNTDDIAKFVKLTNEKGTDVTDKYTVDISSTSAKVEDGVVDNVTESETAYVQVTVKSGSDVVKQSDAIKVTLTNNVVSGIVGFGLSDSNITTEGAYKTAVKNETLTKEMKKSATPYVELLANVNGSEKLLEGTDVTKVENLTPTVATVSKDGDGNLVVDAYSTGTAQVKLTIGDYTTTISFAVKADSVLTNATLSKSSVTFNTADGTASTSTANVNVVDQYGKDFEATVVGSTGVVSVGGTEVGTLTAKSSNNNVATATISDVLTADSKLPITITEVGKGTATVTVTFKNTKGAVVFTKTLTVTGKDSGAFAGYSIETDATAIDLDKDSASEVNDDEVNFKVYEVDAQGNKIGLTASAVTLEIQGYDKDPEVKKYIDVDPTDLKVAVIDEDAFKKFAGKGTLNVDIKVNGTKVGNKAIAYSNSDSVATTASIDTSTVVIDNDKIDGTTDKALTLDELFTGHYNTSTSKYTVAPKLSIKDQSSKVIDFDTTSATPGTLVNTDVASGLVYTLTNVSSNLDTTASTVSLKEGKDSGTFTVVVSKIDTDNVSDILSAPVAFNVTIVD